MPGARTTASLEICAVTALSITRSPSTAYGREDAPETLSAGLFAALRALDVPGVQRIFARCPEGGGIAYAVQNRLRKSAGFHIVNGDTE